MKKTLLSIATSAGMLLTACSQSGPAAVPAGGSGALMQQSAPAAAAHLASTCPCFTVLYNFAGTANGATDGSMPSGTLSDVNGIFYGTTQKGGTGAARGTVYSMTPSGVESVLHDFQGGSDGDGPQAGVLSMEGLLYGTTIRGGTNNHGTVFSVTPTGTEAVLHDFGWMSGGLNPTSSLINVNGTMYGTTLTGGGLSNPGDGVVYSAFTSGQVKVVHRFAGGSDGKAPLDLISSNNVLYGTTAQGGTMNLGTVYSSTTGGAETVLYNFQGGTNDGATPASALTNVGGVFYGVTAAGGANNLGTVYSITSAGAERVAYSFKGGAGDGAIPSSGVVSLNNALFGMTSTGGQFNAGTIFRIGANGTETIVHSFDGAAGGAQPSSSKLYVSGGVLYGTTKGGGTSGAGTFFSFKP